MKIIDETVIKGNRAMCRSYAKINLTLDITGKLENGYHSLQTIMQTVGLSDLVIVDKTHSRDIMLSTNIKFLPTNEKNIAYKAAALFYKSAGLRGGAKILIHKNIPVAAGLAGGSGNGAAVLAALNMLHGGFFSDKELKKLSSQLGADVPYCLEGGTVLAEGIGDILTPLKSIGKKIVMLVTPPIAVSTPEGYAAYDSSCDKIPHCDTAGAVSAIENGNFGELCERLSNSFEPVTIKKYPVIRGIKEKMLMNGAAAALMSGSGPTVFGFFDDFKTAKTSADSFATLYKDVYLTTTV